MKDNRKMLNTLIETRKKNDKMIEAQIHKLGEQLVKLKLSEVEKSSLKEPYQDYVDLKSLSIENKKKIDQIDALELRIKNINNDSIRINNEIRERKKEVKTHFEELGMAAYSSYQKNFTEEKSFEDLFFKIEKFENDITRMEQTLGKLNSIVNKKNLIKRISGSSRIIYLQSKLKSKKFMQSVIYKNLGEKVYESDFLKDYGDTILISNMKPVVEAQEVISSLTKEVEILQNNKIKLIDEIDRLDGHSGDRTSTKKIEIEVQTVEKQMDTLCYKLGKIFLEDSLNGEIKSKGIDKIFLNISSLNNENENINLQIEKQEAEIRINRIEKDILDINNRINNYKNDIQKKQNEIETLLQSIIELEKEKKEQMKFCVK